MCNTENYLKGGGKDDTTQHFKYVTCLLWCGYSGKTIRFGGIKQVFFLPGFSQKNSVPNLTCKAF